MKLNVYSVLDTKTGIFCRPFFMPNDAAALRDLQFAAADLSTDVGRYPSDFNLFRIGSFQDVTGLITPEPAPVSLGLASTLLPKE